MERSLGFDRAADYYDRTRGFSSEAFEALMDVLVGELGGRGRCLEIGVGTGLLALPLAERGIPMIGADLARPMLDKLVEKASGAPPFPLVQADATRLPFREDVFGCAIFRHVLHLIPRWQGAVSEVVRVVAPGGRILTVDGPFSDEGWEIVERFLAEAGGILFSVGLRPDDPDTLAGVLSALGACGADLASIPDTDPVTIRAFLDQMDLGMHSWTWRVDEDTRRRAVAAVRSWARTHFGSLDAPVSARYRVTVRRYELRQAAPPA